MKYLYNNGKLYTENGKRFKGAGKLEFVQKTLDALNTIASGDFGGEWIGGMQASSDHYNIKLGTTPDNENKTLGKTAYLNCDVSVPIPTASGTKKPCYIRLAHELGHLYSDYKGFRDNATWVKSSSLEIDQYQISRDEWYASLVENMVRSDQGLNLRIHIYTG